MPAEEERRKRRGISWRRLLKSLISCKTSRPERLADEAAQPPQPPIPFPSFSVRGLEFRLLGPLGSGAYGDVFLARCPERPPPPLPHLLALKLHTRARPPACPPPDFAASQRLARALAGPPHPLIVGLLGHVTTHGSDRLTLMEFCHRGDLQRAAGRCWEAEAAFVSLEVAEALGHLHERGVCHLDVRPCNVLLSGPGHCRLADFSLADFRPPGRQLELRARFACRADCGSDWLPPEIRRDGRPSPAGGFTDWFGLGALAASLLAADHSEDVGSPDFRHFVSRLRCPQPGHRLGSQGGVAEVLSHGFVTGRAARLLEIPLLPAAEADGGGVAGLRDLLRRQRLRPPDRLLRLVPELGTAGAE
ncbi:hypothetical protein BOX15_Mlig005353g2 [Macrostomum lignano]|uniref:Serine/threonine-protein kinase greatwall n=1 Tax=Macrostomum lignano TaxID=282301 RepID=A0A267FID9_9PLAT|nr:hypothetical protein BOX15_Mlig005353g1 [Macrostomum lignano]PAA90585.1 hypothetical protein BOX15_Mlig005353g2 [Macrostomum lignano]